MSSIPGRFLDEDFVQEMYVRTLTADEVARVLQAWEPFRERIEHALDDYDEDEQSWRDYRNAVFDWLPDPLAPKMSGPADNTDRCPTCSMMPHVHGCTPGKCRAPKPEPELPPEKWVLTSRGARPATTAEEEAAPTPPHPHPLPWHWVDLDRGNDWALWDANDRNLITATNSGTLAVDSAYVRAVTERAKALEQSLRWALSHLDDFVGFRDLESEQRMKDAAARKLLAEIDAAKAGGNG